MKQKYLMKQKNAISLDKCEQTLKKQPGKAYIKKYISFANNNREQEASFKSYVLCSPELANITLIWMSI